MRADDPTHDEFPHATTACMNLVYNIAYAREVASATLRDTVRGAIEISTARLLSAKGRGSV
jgi:hypothetical protein